MLRPFCVQILRFPPNFLLQESSCEKWKSSENRRLSTSELGTTWPPSSLGASPWNTLTQRTSPNLMKGTGWNDREHWGRGERDLLVVDGKTCSGAPLSISAPWLAIKEEEAFGHPHFHNRASFLFYLFISLSRCSLFLVERLHAALIGLSSVSRVFFSFFFLSFIYFCSNNSWFISSLLVYMKMAF